MSSKKILVKEAPKEFLQYNEVDLSPECLPNPIFKEMKSPPELDPSTGKQIKAGVGYYTAPLIHKTRGKDGKLRVDRAFQVEGPIMTSEGGIVVRKKAGKGYEASVWVPHDLEKKEMSDFIGEPIDAADFAKMPEKNTVNEEGIITENGKESVGFLSQLHLRLLLFAFDKRADIGISDCKKLANFEGKFKHPLKFTYNPDGTVMLGKNPTKYWKVFLLGNPEGKCKRAPFSIPVPISEEYPEGEQVMDWCFLQDVRLIFRPLITFKSIYCGSDKLSIQCEISSGVVYSFEPLNNNCLQTITLSKAREDTSLIQTLQEQLAKAREQLTKNGKPTLKLAEALEEKGEEKKSGLQLKNDEPKKSEEPKTSKKASKKIEESEEEEEEPVTLKKSSKLKKSKETEAEDTTELL